MAAMSITKADHPAKTRVAIRVGVTGHRPNRLGTTDRPDLRRQVENILKLVRDGGQRIAADPEAGYDSSAPLLRIISPLAEGSDRLVAEEAVKLGFELQCPLPFPRDDYERDFATPESRKHFRDFSKEATAILELDGSRESSQAENRAYENVGRTVLRHSDLLIAIWDGERAEGRGGTAQIVKEAVQLGIPVIWIHTETPHAISLLVAADSEGHRQTNVAELPMLLNNLLLFQPTAASKSSEGKTADIREHYFREKHHTWTLGVLFRLFSKVTAGSSPWPLRFLIKDYEKETTEEWKEAWAASPDVPPPARHQVEAAFLHHYAWADKLANHYANIYRSSFLVNYLLAACAVLFALRAYFDVPSHLRFWIGMELGSIIFIIVLTNLGRMQRWHERWIDYRLLAEKLRQMRFLFLIGRGGIPSPARGRNPHEDPGKSWVNWHFHAAARAAGMPRGEFDGPYRAAYRKLLGEYELPSQSKYHAKNSQQFLKIDHRLHWLGTSLFFGTLVVCIAHLFDPHGDHHKVLVQLAAILPAFGAALHGIGSQGDFHKVAQRSTVVNQRLNAIMTQLNKAQDSLSSEALGDFAERAADVMGAELVEWRAGLQEKPLGYPS
jgi:hypothetical protein